MRLLPILFLMLISSTLFAQHTAEDVFTSSRMTWFGIDLSKTKLINGAGIPIVEDIKLRYAPSWNKIVIDEPKKFDLNKLYGKSLVAKDLQSVHEINKEIDTDKLVTYDENYTIQTETVEEMVKRYDSKAAEGIGLVYIVESLDRSSKRATVHVTFFDINTRVILFRKKVEGIPGGKGIRNYWANAYFDVMEKSKKDWRKWYKKLG